MSVKRDCFPLFVTARTVCLLELASVKGDCILLFVTTGTVCLHIVYSSVFPRRISSINLIFNQWFGILSLQMLLKVN